MRFAFIEDQKKHQQWPTAKACDVLGVSRSGYYAFSSRQDASGKPSPRQARHQRLIEQVRLSYLRSHQRYGAPKITLDLKRRGTKVCLNTVAKIMRETGLSARRHRRFVP